MIPSAVPIKKLLGRGSLTKDEARVVGAWLTSRGWTESGKPSREIWTHPTIGSGDDSLREAAKLQVTASAVALLEARGYEVTGGGSGERNGVVYWVRVLELRRPRVNERSGGYCTLGAALKREGFMT